MMTSRQEALFCRARVARAHRRLCVVVNPVRAGILSLILGCLMGVGRVGAGEGSAPRIQVASEDHDFGQIAVGAIVSHEFAFTNIGGAPLEILSVQPSCGCTTVEQAEQTVEPGQRGVIPIQFNSRGFSGKVNKSIRVTSNDPEQSSLVLRITAEVWTPIRLEPKTLVFQYDSAATTGETKVVRISNNLEKAINIEEPESTHKAFRLELKTLEPGREFELHVQTVPPIGTGTVSMPISLHTSAEAMPLLKTQAHAIERQPILVSPSEVRLPVGKLEAARKIRVVVRSQSGFDLKLSRPQLDLPGVLMGLEEVQPGRLFQLNLEFPAGLELAAGQPSELTIECNHPRYPLLRVPIQAVAAKPVKPRPQTVAPSRRPVPQAESGPSGPREVPGRD